MIKNCPGLVRRCVFPYWVPAWVDVDNLGSAIPTRVEKEPGYYPVYFFNGVAVSWDLVAGEDNWNSYLASIPAPGSGSYSQLS